jgi:hypothetical protein
VRFAIASNKRLESTGMIEPEGLLDSDLPTWELAKLLASSKSSNTELAARIGRSRTYVGKLRLAWRRACPSLRQAWVEDKVSLDVAKRIANIGDGAEQSRALAEYLRFSSGQSRWAKSRAQKALKKREQLLKEEGLK